MNVVYLSSSDLLVAFELFFAPVAQVGERCDVCRNETCRDEFRLEQVAEGLRCAGVPLVGKFVEVLLGQRPAFDDPGDVCDRRDAGRGLEQNC